MTTTTNTIDRTAEHDGITVCDGLATSGLVLIDWTPLVREERVLRMVREMDAARRARAARPARLSRSVSWAVRLAAVLGVVR